MTKFESISDMKGTTLIKFAHTSIEEGSKINSDAYRSYNALPKDGYSLEAKKFNPMESPDHLKWIHTVISNVKALIAGTYHGLDEKHLQTYLDEFCYRFNRRKFKGELFNRLLSCCATTRTIAYSELMGCSYKILLASQI